MSNQRTSAGTAADSDTQPIVNSSADIEANPMLCAVYIDKSNLEIIGIGYSKEVEIGESYLQESVVNMWLFAPQGAFTYYSANGSQMVLQEMTKVAKDRHNVRTLSIGEITIDIKNRLVAKGQRVLA